MAKQEDTEAEEPAKGSRKKLLLVALVLVALTAGIGSRVIGGGTAPAAADASAPPTTEPHGQVTAVESITVNLADGHFLKVGLAFEIHKGEQYPPKSVEIDSYTKGFAREVDAAIMVLSTFTYDQLVAPDGKVYAKAALNERLAEVSDGAIRDVLFHEFVMQ